LKVLTDLPVSFLFEDDEEKRLPQQQHPNIQQQMNVQ